MTEVIPSRKVSAAINKKMKPLLKSDGFEHFKGRSAYKFDSIGVFGFHTRAVGNYFSEITGFSPASFTATLSISFNKIPSEYSKPDKNGVIIPKQMDRNLELNITNKFHQKRTGVREGAEHNRKDVWWVASDGSNLNDVIDDLFEAYSSQATSWYNLYTNPSKVIEVVSNENTCFNKFELLYAMALEVNDKKLIATYKELYYKYLPKWISDDPSLMIKP